MATTADYYSIEEAETYTYTDFDEEVGRYLDGLEPAYWPDTVTVMAFTRDRVSDYMRKLLPREVRQHGIELLDQEYGDFLDGDSCLTEHPDSREVVEEAARAFAAVILEHYVPWTVSRAPELDVEVDVREWIARERPGWTRCPNCESHRVGTRIVDRVPVRHCEECGLEYTDHVAERALDASAK